MNHIKITILEKSMKRYLISGACYSLVVFQRKVLIYLFFTKKNCINLTKINRFVFKRV